MGQTQYCSARELPSQVYSAQTRKMLTDRRLDDHAILADARVLHLVLAGMQIGCFRIASAFLPARQAIK